MRAGAEHANRTAPKVFTPSLGLDVSSNTLQGWKEIACELNRGVRTVQRWERELGLPVRRIRNGLNSPVFAFKNELHAWLEKRGEAHACAGPGPVPARLTNEARLKRKAKVLRALEKLLSADTRHGEVNCPECESPMQVLKFYFRIYGIRQKRSLSIPICTKCNVGGLESLKHYQYIQ
jgi:hypothetical protein